METSSPRFISVFIALYTPKTFTQLGSVNIIKSATASPSTGGPHAHTNPNHPSAAWLLPLPYGSHDLVCTLALVQPGVLAVAHQVAHLHFLASHVLVEITDVQLFELLQTQHTCGRIGKAN